MPSKEDMSVSEILAACRQGDSPDSTTQADPGPPAPAPESQDGMSQETEPKGAAAIEKPPVEQRAAGGPTDPGSMSVADILAAARQGDKPSSGAPSAGSPESETAPPAGDSPTVAAATTESGPGGTGKPAREMSVAEMLAAARAGKGSAGQPPAAKGEVPSKESPAAGQSTKKKTSAESPKRASAASREKKPADPAPSVPRETSSILAAARSDAQRGPISKAEAAARQRVEPEARPAARKAKLTVPAKPAKSDYVVPAQPVDVATEERRGFFAAAAGVLLGSSLAIGFTSLAATHLVWLLGMARFMFPNVLTEPPTMFKVGFPGDYADGQVQTKFKAQFGVWIVRYEYEGQPQIFAIKSVCTHLGCTPNWLEGEQKFKCPCHGSGFYKEGINFEGPAPRPLERYAIRIADDGQLEVDKSRKFQEELGQWADPASFVSV